MEKKVAKGYGNLLPCTGSYHLPKGKVMRAHVGTYSNTDLPVLVPFP